MKTELTLKLAKELKGVQIETIAYGYKANSPYEHIFIVGELISQFDYAAELIYPIVDTNKYTQYANYQQYWLSYMSDRQLKEAKDTLILLTDKRVPVGMLCHNLGYFDEPTFTESDADRPVYFQKLIKA